MVRRKGGWEIYGEPGEVERGGADAREGVYVVELEAIQADSEGKPEHDNREGAEKLERRDREECSELMAEVGEGEAQCGMDDMGAGEMEIGKCMEEGNTDGEGGVVIREGGGVGDAVTGSGDVENKGGRGGMYVLGFEAEEGRCEDMKGDGGQEVGGAEGADGEGQDVGAENGEGNGGSSEKEGKGDEDASGAAGDGTGDEDKGGMAGNGRSPPEKEDASPPPGDVGEAVRDGWHVGVCGVQQLQSWRRSGRMEEGDGDGDGARGEEEEDAWVQCDFITEFIAPGVGYGKRGAGIRLLGEVYEHMMNGYGGREYVGEGIQRGCGGQGYEDEREVHGYVSSKKVNAIKWWEMRGMHTIWGCEDDEGWWDGAGVTRRVHRTNDPEEMGYMRGTWRNVGAVMAHPAMGEEPLSLLKPH